MTDSPFTPEQFAAARDQVQRPPVGTGPADMAAAAAGGAATEVDVAALLAKLQAEVELLKAAQRQAPAGEHRLVSDAHAARGLLEEHFARGGRGNAGDVLRLADDVIDAGHNAVESGDAGPARDVAAKLARALHAIHPGGKDSHYFTQALSIVEHGLQAAADTVGSPAPSNALGVAGGPPAKVVAGSVTG